MFDPSVNLTALCGNQSINLWDESISDIGQCFTSLVLVSPVHALLAGVCAYRIGYRQPQVIPTPHICYSLINILHKNQISIAPKLGSHGTYLNKYLLTCDCIACISVLHPDAKTSGRSYNSSFEHNNYGSPSTGCKPSAVLVEDGHSQGRRPVRNCRNRHTGWSDFRIVFQQVVEQKLKQILKLPPNLSFPAIQAAVKAALSIEKT